MKKQYTKHQKRSRRSYGTKRGLYNMQRFKNARPMPRLSLHGLFSRHSYF